MLNEDLANGLPVGGADVSYRQWRRGGQQQRLRNRTGMHRISLMAAILPHMEGNEETLRYFLLTNSPIRVEGNLRRTAICNHAIDWKRLQHAIWEVYWKCGRLENMETEMRRLNYIHNISEMRRSESETSEMKNVK